MKTLIISLIPFILLSQPQIENEIDSALVNAKKGIYWCLSNLNNNKLRLSNELIADNKLYSVVKFSREVDGVKIESKGIFNSTEIEIKLYRSNDFLLKEGYLRQEQPDSLSSGKKKKL